MAERTYDPPMTLGDQRWMERKNAITAHWARPDWRATLDDIAWEAATFHNEIPFSGDTRTLLESPVHGKDQEGL